jgi:hypothetical protein
MFVRKIVTRSRELRGFFCMYLFHRIYVRVVQYFTVVCNYAKAQILYIIEWQSSNRRILGYNGWNKPL